MKLDEIDKQVTQSDISALETFADRLFAKVGIDVEFTRHFLDRVNDARNNKQITMGELTRLFKQEFKKWGKPIAQLGPDQEAVMKDMVTNINMPFALRWDHKNNELDLIAKTVMRKKNFKTSNKEFPVESMEDREDRTDVADRLADLANSQITGYFSSEDELHDFMYNELTSDEDYHDGGKTVDWAMGRVNDDVKGWIFNEEVEVSLHGDAKKGYVLSKIEVSGDERNAGQGTKAMQDIVDRMDREGAAIALTPDDAFGGNKNRLIKFYKRFGFVPNKGRNKDFRFRETMIRYPKSNESVNEGYKLQLERDTDMMVLNITDTVTGKRTEVRGKSGYETNGYDANDKLHQLLDKISKTANISELMNGEPVGINPKHPDGKNAKAHTDKAFNEEKLETTSIITPSIKVLDKIFKQNKFEIRIVGGAVRDIALGKEPKDIDFATDATPDEMQKIFDKAGIRHIPTGIEHGTITAVINGEDFEITTLRADKETDGRHAEVEFVKSWEEDAKRRDLTYNAMSMDIDGELYDYHDGMDDLQNKVSKFVGDPEQRITEDYLRILRYFRFQGRLAEPTWDKDTLQAIKKHAKGLSGVSAERIWAEMSKALSGQNVASLVSTMHKTGVAQVIGLNVSNLSVIKDGGNPIIALAQLDNNVDIAKRWKMKNTEAELLGFLVKHKNDPLDQKKVEDMIADGVKRELITALASMQNKNVNIDAKVPDFPVSGADLIATGMKPGPDLGKKLAQLKQQWKAGNFKASKEDLLNTSKE